MVISTWYVSSLSRFFVANSYATALFDLFFFVSSLSLKSPSLLTLINLLRPHFSFFVLAFFMFSEKTEEQERKYSKFFISPRASVPTNWVT